jgi:hypothetical protein
MRPMARNALTTALFPIWARYKGIVGFCPKYHSNCSMVYSQSAGKKPCSSWGKSSARKDYRHRKKARVSLPVSTRAWQKCADSCEASRRQRSSARTSCGGHVSAARIKPARSGLTPSAASVSLLPSPCRTRCRFPSRCLVFLCSPMPVFDQLRPLFETAQPKRGRTTEHWRRRVEAVLWVARTASALRQLPQDFGPWETVVYHYRRWGKAGLWERILQILLPQSASHVPPLALPAP